MSRRDTPERRAVANARTRRWRANRSAEEKAADHALQREWRARNPDKVRISKETARAKQYGLSREAWDAIFEAQGKACATCQATSPGGSGWQTDHDHTCCAGKRSCGKCVRGILCTRCNFAIGLLGDTVDSVASLAKAFIVYISKARS